MTTSSTTEYKQENLLKQTLDLLENDKLEHLASRFEHCHPVDIANVISSLPLAKRLSVWEVVPESISGNVLNELDDNIRASLLEVMNTPEMLSAFEALNEDDVADLIQDVPERTDEILTLMGADRRKRLEKVLYYPEDVAGGLMDVDIVSIRADVTVGAVLRYLRQLGELPEGTNKLFVTDREGRYQGQVLVTSLLTNHSEVSIDSIMRRDLSIISADLDVKEVAEIFARNDLITAPVLDDKNFLLGRITIDDVVDLIRDANQDSMLKLAGTSHENIFTSIWQSSQSRALWLGINLLTALLASMVISEFELVIKELVALAVLMPIVASMGGIAGSQTLSLIIRTIALGQLRKGNQYWLLKKEMGVGLLNGLLWAIIIAAIAGLWFDSLLISGIIGMAILVNLITATTSGVAIPLIMHKIDIDPAVAGGVILTTITDVVGFLSFLGLASLLIM